VATRIALQLNKIVPQVLPSQCHRTKVVAKTVTLIMYRHNTITVSIEWHGLHINIEIQLFPSHCQCTKANDITMALTLQYSGTVCIV
jgi:hypothetical protein